MDLSKQEIQTLLTEIERLRLENAILRRAAGIQISPEPSSEQAHVTANERQALWKKTP